jgi:hypothetical protein
LEGQQQQQLVARLRARLLGRTTEAFADELDALRTSDGTFKGVCVCVCVSVYVWCGDRRSI